MLILGTNFGAKPLSFSTWPWIMLIASSFIGIAISHVTYYQSLKKLGVSISVGIIQLQPIITAVGSTLIFDEKLSPPQWISGCIGILGAIIMLATPKPSAPPKPSINPGQAQ
jgi:drug/metabolite transporter (DMT)-like permease